MLPSHNSSYNFYPSLRSWDCPDHSSYKPYNLYQHQDFNPFWGRMGYGYTNWGRSAQRRFGPDLHLNQQTLERLTEAFRNGIGGINPTTIRKVYDTDRSGYLSPGDTAQISRLYSNDQAYTRLSADVIRRAERS